MMVSPARSLFLASSLLSAFLAPAAAQTWSECNPMEVTTCADNPALGGSYNFDFSNASNESTWNATSGTVKHTSDGGEFTVAKRYDSPTIQSEFYIMFGVVEVHMKAATGQGIISSIVLESDDLDEVDWEFMGGDLTHAESNYFGKGNTTDFTRAVYHPMTKPGPMDAFHNYTIRWTSAAIEWYIDTALIRTLKYKDAYDGYNFPQTPMNVRLGIWAGGDPSNNNGTIEWAGGLTDFSKGPYTMIVKSIKVQDYGSGKAYHWSDKSGSFTSIKAIAGNSTALDTLNNPSAHKTDSTSTNSTTSTTSSNSTNSSNSTSSSGASSSASTDSSISQKWESLQPGVRIGIYSAAGCVAACLAGLITFCCIRQRRAGKKEQAAYQDRIEQERLENQAFAGDAKGPDSLPSSATPGEYNNTGASYFEKPGQFGNNTTSSPSPPPAFASVNNGNPRSPTGNGTNSPFNGPLPNAPSNGPNGPLPNLPMNGPNSSRSPPPGGPGFNGLYNDNAGRPGNGPGSMRSNNGGNNFNDPRGFNGARSPANGSNSPRGFNGPPNNNSFGDMPPRLGTPGSMRSNSGFGGQAPPSPRDFTSNNGNFGPMPMPLSGGNGPPRMMGGGPGSVRSNNGGGGGFSNYGDGGLKSPNLPIGYADGGMRSPSNFSHPGNFSPRSQSPRVPLVQAQSPRDYYPPGQAQYGGSSGGNYFNNQNQNPNQNQGNNGYTRPGAF